MRTWSGPAIMAKVFVPLTMAFLAGLVAVPIRDAFTAAWFFLVVLPMEGAAVWLFSNIGEIGPSSNGVLYRRWVKWRHIPSAEISNVASVFPCFAALVLNEHVRLLFFPDRDTRRLIRSLPGAVQSSDVPAQTADPISVPHKVSPLWRGIISFLIGIGSGLAIAAVRSSVAHHRAKSTALTLFESRYLPLFVGACVLYLTGLIVARRVKARELHLSLAMIGLGTAYLSSAMFHIL